MKPRTSPKGSARRAAKQVAFQPESQPAEFKVVRLRECPVESAALDNPEQVVKLWRDHVESAPWFKADKECLVVFLLDTRLQVMGFEMLSQGTKDTLLVNVPEVFRLAAMKSAAKIVVAHNHPSGNPSPSEADINVTRDLIRAGELLKIEVNDHVIIGARRAGVKDYSSLKELGFFYGDRASVKADSSVGGGSAIASVVALPSTKTEVPARSSSIREPKPDMEYAVQYTLGLLELFARMNSIVTRGNGTHLSYQAIGCSMLADNCGMMLYDHWKAAHAAKFPSRETVLSDADKAALFRRLGVTVSKTGALLLMLAHELSLGGGFDEYERAQSERALPPADSSPYLSLASDCVEFLEASCAADFGPSLKGLADYRAAA